MSFGLRLVVQKSKTAVDSLYAYKCCSYLKDHNYIKYFLLLDTVPLAHNNSFWRRCQNVVLKLMRRHHVTSTSVPHHHDVKRKLGCFPCVMTLNDHWYGLGSALLCLLGYEQTCKIICI